MKVLFACDGPQAVDAITEEIFRTGLPANGKALVLCVGQSPSTQLLTEIAREKIQPQIRGWDITCEALTGAPQDVILHASRLWHPDLLMLSGQPGLDDTNAATRNLSLDLVRQARCSVRMVRPRTHSKQDSIRLLIGHDGSRSAAAIHAAFARRNWPVDAEALVVSVLKSSSAVNLSTLSEGGRSFASLLRRPGLRVDATAIEGDPWRILIQEAERFNADSIFVGARDPMGPDRFAMGSVATAVWAQARCPVEVVR